VASRAGKYEAIFTSGEDIGIFIAVAMRLTGVRTPLVIVTHGPLFMSPKYRLLLSLVRGMPNVVWACLSASLADWLVKEHGLDPKRCLPTGYGVDVDFYATEEGPTEPMVASAGTSNRDYDTLIAAVAETGVDTRIAAHSFWDGVSPDLDRPRPPNVEMRSYGDYANLRELYRAARMIVVPTFDRPYACGFAVTAEAMAVGRPLIVPRGRVVGDYVVEGVTGFYYSPGDVAELGARIQLLLDDPDLAAKIGREGAKRMRENYSLPIYVDRLIEAARAAGAPAATSAAG
jgi:glycosyltransferase involved in cell wall biosynthesis